MEFSNRKTAEVDWNLHFMKNIISECRKFGVIWVYAGSFLEVLGKRTRRRIYSGRMIKAVERCAREEMKCRSRFTSRKDVENCFRKLLHQKLGI